MKSDNYLIENKVRGTDLTFPGRRHIYFRFQIDPNNTEHTHTQLLCTCVFTIIVFPLVMCTEIKYHLCTLQLNVLAQRDHKYNSWTLSI